MKRRVGIKNKNATPGSSTARDSSKKPSGAARNAQKRNSGLAAGPHEDADLSRSATLNVPPWQTSTSPVTANADAQGRSGLYPLSKTFINPTGQTAIARRTTTFNHRQTISPMHTACGASPANGQAANLVKTTTFVPQCHRISPLRNGCCGRMAPPSRSPSTSRDPQLPVSEAPSPNLTSASNGWDQLPSMTTDAPAAPLQKMPHSSVISST